MTRKKVTQNDESESKPFSRKEFINSVIKKRQKNKFLSEHQETYYDILKSNEITIIDFVGVKNARRCSTKYY